MSIDIIQERLSSYQPKSKQDEENALKEITQEVVLSALSRANFFSIARFQGGTCLRIIYDLRRFSEDLDFALLRPQTNFKWKPFLNKIGEELKTYGYDFNIQDKSGKNKAVQLALLKEDSIGNVLTLKHNNVSTLSQIKIKLEIDTNPPEGSHQEQKFVDFPVTVPILVDDRPSLFAGKSHALLCRETGKGRDWYDFDWYISKKIQLNFFQLSAAIDQMGPWKGRGIKIDKTWYVKEMRNKIKSTDWDKQKKEVSRFLKPEDLDLLEHWSSDFFLQRLKKLESYLLFSSIATSAKDS